MAGPVFHCDICGKETSVNPPTETVMEDREVEYEVPDIDPNDVEGTRNRTKKMSITQKLPKIAKMKRQNPFTGTIENIDVPMMRDLKDRAYILQLSIGHEAVQRDFCHDCLKAEIMPIVQPLWDRLALIHPQGDDL
jgi:hypothetical protein